MIVIYFSGYAWRCCTWWIPGLASLLKLIASVLLFTWTAVLLIAISNQGCTILSGDVIIRHLAEHFKPEYVVFLVSTLPDNWFSFIVFKFTDESLLCCYLSALLSPFHFSFILDWRRTFWEYTTNHHQKAMQYSWEKLVMTQSKPNQWFFFFGGFFLWLYKFCQENVMF